MKHFLLLLSAFIVLKVNAQWIGDSTLNNAIAKGNLANSRNSLVSVRAEDGAMYLAWEDTTNAATIGTNVYLQKINTDGSIAFAENGLAVTNISGSQTDIAMISDGEGGVIIAWQDTRTNNRSDIYGQRVLANGSFGWEVNGKLLADSTGLQQSPTLCKGPDGEIIMLYRTSLIDFGSTTSYDLYVTKFSIATGAFVASKIVANGPNIQTAQSIKPDMNGGAYIVWQDPYKGNSEADIQAQRITSTLDTMWAGTNANGITVCNATANQLAPAFEVDATGITIAWGDLRAGATNSDIYVQRFNSAGSPQWTANGIAVCNATGNQTNARIVRSNNASIVAWGDNRVSTSNRDLYAQKISDADGSALWPTANGTPITIATGNQPNSTTSGFVVISDLNDGAFFIWDDARNGSSNLDVRAQQINSSGAVQWTVNGAAVAIGTANQNQPVAVADNDGGIIVAWRDSRSATGAEIYASRVRKTGILVLPVDFVSVKASLKGTEAIVSWKVANEINVAKYIVEKLVNGVAQTLGTITAKQVNQYQFTDATLLANENLYRIKAVDNDGKITYSSTVRVVNTQQAKVMVKILPNPVRNQFTIQAFNLTKGNYQAKIVRSNGSVVLEKRLFIADSIQQINIQSASLAAGSYFLVIANEKGEVVSTNALEKL